MAKVRVTLWFPDTNYVSKRLEGLTTQIRGQRCIIQDVQPVTVKRKGKR